MKPQILIRAMGDHWPLISTIAEHFGSRLISESQLIKLIDKSRQDKSVPAYEIVARFARVGILSEFVRGGRGYSINPQVLPFIEFLLEKQQLGLVEEIALNTDHLKVHLEEIRIALEAGSRTPYFLACQEIQSRFQNLRRMVQANSKAIYHLVDEAKLADQNAPLAERYKKVIKAWDEYITPAIKMKSIGEPFDLAISRVKHQIEEWLNDPGIHLLVSEDTRSELDSIHYQMLDFKESLDRSIDVMSQHLAPLVQKARINTQIAKGAAIAFRDLTHYDSRLSRSGEASLPGVKRVPRKPDADSLVSFYTEFRHYDSEKKEIEIRSSISLSAKKARGARENIPDIVKWLMNNKPVEDIVLTIQQQFPDARPVTVLKVLNKLSSQLDVRRHIVRHDEKNHYPFKEMTVLMHRRSFNKDKVDRPAPPVVESDEVLIPSSHAKA